MLKVIIYLFPILVNYLGGGMAYITANRFSEAGADKIFVSSTSAVWAVAYFCVSLCMGKLVTEKRAVPMIISAAFLLALFSVGFLVIANVYFQYVWIFLYGIAMATYCTPFQVFMKRIGGGTNGVVYSTAMYTWSWSFGNACGPFIFGSLPNWEVGFIINAIIATALGIMVIMTNAYLNKHPQVAPEDTTQTTSNSPATNLYKGRPDLAWLGWLGLIVGFSTLCIVRTLQQDLLLTELNIGRDHSGYMLTCLGLVQGFFAMSLMKSKTWMYSPIPNILAGAVGIASMLLIATGKNVLAFYVASTIYGFYSGYYYFMLVFHSLIHPTKSGKYVGINEAVVGIVGILASVGGGALADLTSNRTTFVVCAVCIALITIVQSTILAKTQHQFKVVH